MNIPASGATQAGKTTMLNCLSYLIPPRERVITCEEIFELTGSARDVGGSAVSPAEPGMAPARLSAAAWSQEALRSAPTASSWWRCARRNLDMLNRLNAGLPGMRSEGA